ncbi:MAG: hypothetical protein QOC99_3394 [Acidobacteriota bacterium]|jgi:hypothetical protein|nr:hypothetical protein [Acidobacteriota bacterium]
MLRGSFLAAILFILLPAAASAQPTQDKQDNVPPPSTPQKPGDLGSPAEEMLRRAEIKHEEQSHQEMVERADEAAHIGDEILASYKKNHSLSHDDLKKLERLEKLARKIRGSTGGSDDDASLQDPPGKIEEAVKRLAELSDALKKSVEKTSRLVISAAVIEHSNELIELIRHIRNIQQP